MNEQVLLLLKQLLSEQQKTNNLLCLLIDALADAEPGTTEANTYLDGTSV